MAWDVTVVNTLAESYLSISASGRCSGACRGEKVSKVLVSAIFPHLPTVVYSDIWWCTS